MTNCQSIFEVSGNFHTDLVSPWIEEGEVIPMDIYTASSLGYIDEVRNFLRSGTINKKNLGGWTPLMYASYVGHGTVVKLLLDEGNVDVDVRTYKWSATELMLAASCGNEGVVNALLKSGANINAADKRGYTPLFYAILQRHQNVVKILIDKGADLERRENTYGMTPHLLAAREGHEGIFNLILRSRGNAKGRAANGLSARQLAYNNGHMAIVNLIDVETFKRVPNAMVRSEPQLVGDNCGLHPELGSSLGNTNRSYGLQGTSIKHGPKAFARLISQKSSNPTEHPSIQNAIRNNHIRDTSQPQFIPNQESIHQSIQSSSPKMIPHSPSSDSEGSNEDFHFAHSGGTITDHSSLNERLMKFRLQNNGVVSPPRSRSCYPYTIEYQLIFDFLHDLNLDKYVPTFIEQEVDFKTLLTLKDADLREIGINLFGPRRKITKAITDWEDAQSKQKPNAASLQDELSELKLQLQESMLQLQQQELYLKEEKELRVVLEGCILEEKKKCQQANANAQKVSNTVSRILPELEELSKILSHLCNKSNDDITKEIFTKLAGSVDKITPVLKEVAEETCNGKTHTDSKDLISECVHSKSG